MTSALLLIPFFLIRFGLLALLDKAAVRRAAYFPPPEGKEMAAYWFYQLSNAAIFICMFFLNIKTGPPGAFYAGVAVYAAGAVLLAVSIINFASPSGSGINQSGLYRVSRNPMYVAYFLYFIGCVLLTQSWLLLGIVLMFQLSAHWIIRAEERWCVRQFGAEYTQYMKKVRRYF